MAQVTMPKMSDTMEEGTIVRWLKHPGDQVTEGEPIAEVETDKANVEMEAFNSGVLGQILVTEGQTVPVGQLIATIEAPGAAPAPPAPKAEAPPAPQAQPAPEAAPPPPPAPKAEAPAPPAPPAEEEERMKVSPLARRLAQEYGVDLSQVHGTGPNGRIVEADIENYVARKGAAPPAPAPPTPEAVPAPAPPAPKAAAPATEVPFDEVPLSRMRKTIAERMANSTRTIPHFYVTTEVEMDWAARVRDELNADESQPKISFNDLVIKACALALTKFPRVNASFEGDKLRVYKQVNVGMAVALDDGLIVPVVHDADKKHLREIAAQTKELAQHARDNQLRAHEFTGSTFTVTNLGMFGIEEFSAIINPPEAATLSIGGIHDEPVVIDGQVAVAKRMKITVSADHRVIDGAEAAKFIQEVKHQLESPIGLL
jgi:pyruvate dehydrogenase E2 component (dihydrolipoamide acetyltransferase)